MIDVTERGDGIIPLYRKEQVLPDHGFRPVVTQAMFDYFKREMQRDMDDFERGVLTNMLVELKGANRKLTGLGAFGLVQNSDDLVQVFIDRVRAHEAGAASKKIMTGATGGRRDG